MQPSSDDVTVHLADAAVTVDETPAQAEHVSPAPDLAGVSERGRMFWWLVAAIIVADQITKALVRATLPHLFDSVTVIPHLLDLIHVQNDGVAFGLMNDAHVPFKAAATVVMALAALTGITLYARHVRHHEWVARIGLSCILGGAGGNLLDRLVFGHVIDFVDVYRGNAHFWAFNLADSAITIGAILVFVDLLLVNRHASHSV